MDGASALTFKIASEPWEFEQVHRLNYRTFVEEIPQHHANDSGLLVDRFHDQNLYVICLQQGNVIGMVALRNMRPFSLDSKIDNLDQFLPAGGGNISEIRLLATDPSVRGSRVFYGLLGTLAAHLVQTGCDLALISGTTRQLKLYRHLGFVPFAHLVGTPGAMYQPMYLTRAHFREVARKLLPALQSEDGYGRVSFLPGPVDLAPEVRRALAGAPVSHRSDAFMADFERTRRGLCDLTGAAHAQIMTGSGTLANDLVGAQLMLQKSRGLILSNGEFGDRLIDHARRLRLDFVEHAVRWGEPFDLEHIKSIADRQSGLGWIWAVHCETSTGMLNDLPGLTRLARRGGLKLCVDCISSLGTTVVDLSGVFLASANSGKGLRAYPGLAIVLHNHPIEPAESQLPRYLDLGYCASKEGVPFTLCSNLLYALKTSLETMDPPRRFADIAAASAQIREKLAELDVHVVSPARCASPAVITLALPEGVSAVKMGDRLTDAGFSLSYKSDYLLARNWIQICLMGQYSQQTIDAMLAVLRKSTRGRRAGEAALPSGV